MTDKNRDDVLRKLSERLSDFPRNGINSKKRRREKKRKVIVTATMFVAFSLALTAMLSAAVILQALNAPQLTLPAANVDYSMLQATSATTIAGTLFWSVFAVAVETIVYIATLAWRLID